MDHDNDRPHRPSLDTGDHRDAIADLIDHLQRGHDTGDADAYDGMFADDILWGSPKGQALQGFAPLTAIHHTQLTGTPASPASKFELAQASAPTDDVVIAQIRRRARNGAFSEMAMYVLVRQDDRWWLAAGQNTPITDVLPAVD
ncbi:SgcJ/EcaC family oxidoreductase [Williamsia sp. MIQD14]|uniref:SgcJ/EcaC family oxidoreductase n=1 Tax=Williamsia sp. MIQD14 TaxID=3425703 RepID=UPI003DA0007B